MSVRPKTRPEKENNHEDPFECQICLQTFVNPRLLPSCLHSVCGLPRQCLTEALTVKDKACRICGKTPSIPNIDLEDFPKKLLHSAAMKRTEANRSKQIPSNSTPGKQPSRRDDTQTTSNHFIPNYSNALNNINNNRRVNNTNNNNFNSNNRPRGNPYPMCEKHPGLLKSKICSRCRVSICDECWRLEHRDKRLHKVELFEDYREKASKHEKKVPSKVNLNVVKNFDKVFRHQKRMFEQVEHFSRLLTQQREREIALKEQLDHVKTAEEMYEIRLRLKECRNEQPRLVAQMEERYERVSKSLNCSLPLFNEMTKNLPQVENGLFPNAGNQFGMSSNDKLSGEIGSPF